jgi:hydrogenase maturation protein HypF
MSTHFAQRLPLETKIAVQHHHAHIASCMAESRLSGKVIGVAFDGTGYGTDGRIWGGEFLVADFRGFERRAHLRYVPLPGGDAAVRQPWRMALSYLRDTFGAEYAGMDLRLLPEIPNRENTIVNAMLERRINCIDTSSCGRLFDAVSSIVGLRQEVTFEGQAAIELEMIADPGVERVYPYEITADDLAQVDVRPMIESIVRDISRNTPASEIAAAFHNTLAAVIVDACRGIRDTDALNRVCLSGGTFQNMYLLQRAVRGLRRNGFDVFIHAKVPPNDGGIALGQAVIANAILSSSDRSDD